MKRRSFLRLTGAVGALATVGDLRFLGRLPSVSAAEAALDPKIVRFAPEIEPLVRRRDIAHAPLHRGHDALEPVLAHRRDGLRRIARRRGGRQRVAGRIIAVGHVLLVIRALTEHRIEAQAEKGGDRGEDDDFVEHRSNFRLARTRHGASARRVFPLVP